MRVSASLVLPTGRQAPRHVDVRASYGRNAGGEVLERPASVHGGSFEFFLPPGLADIRLAADGFAPVYVWQIAIEGKAADLGPIRLSTGASISGIAVDPQTGARATGLEVRAHAVSRAIEGGQIRLRTRTIGGGFFQLLNVPVGQYELLFLRQSRLISAFGPIDVTGEGELRFDPLPLNPLLTFGLTLNPALTPDGEPWRVQLISDVPVRPEGIAGEKLAVNDGRVQFDGLLPGSHTLLISAGSQRVLLEKVTIESDRWETRELAAVRIAGHVRLSGRPVAATLRFSAGSMDSVALDSDAEGFFSGWMRRPKGNVFVEVRGTDPPFAKNLNLPAAVFSESQASLSIDIENMRLRGRVTLRGRPRAGVRVRAQASDTDFLSATSDEAGEFEIAPLSRARYLVTAYDKNFPRSKPVEVDATSPLDRLDIELAPGRSLQLLVLTPDGAPVAGAQVKVDPVGYSSSFLYQATSVSGALRVPIPAPAGRLFVRVISASAGVWSGCVAAPEEDKPLTLILPGPVFGFGAVEPGGSPPSRILVSRDGGAWAGEDLALWPAALRSPDGAALALPVGDYAGLPLNEPWERFVERWCAAGPSSGMRWTSVDRGLTSVVRSGLR